MLLDVFRTLCNPPLMDFKRDISPGHLLIDWVYRVFDALLSHHTHTPTFVKVTLHYYQTLCGLSLSLMAYLHQRRRTQTRTRILIPNPMYYVEIFPLHRQGYWSWFRPLSWMVTVPILGTNLDISVLVTCIRGSESESEPVETSCIVQQSVLESESISWN